MEGEVRLFYLLKIVTESSWIWNRLIYFIILCADCIRARGHHAAPSIPAGCWGFVGGGGGAQHSGGRHEVSGTGAMAAGYGGAVQTHVARVGEVVHPQQEGQR